MKSASDIARIWSGDRCKDVMLPALGAMTCGAAAQEIRTLLAQVEKLRRERDEVGRALRDEVTARLDAEARALKAEKERDEARQKCALAHAASERCWALVAEGVRVVPRLITSAKMLQQNAEGCAINHYGHDFETHGLPGWLTDTRADIDAARAFLERVKESRS